MGTATGLATKLGMLLLALTLWVPAGAGAQVEDAFRDKVPGLDEQSAPPPPRPPGPDRAIPRATRPDPRLETPVPMERAPVPGRTRVVPGGVGPTDVPSLPRNDLGVRLLAARVVPGARWRTEVEVEVANHGPDPFDREASVRVTVFPEDDGLCRWPNGNLLDVPDLRAGQRRVLLFRGGYQNAECGAPNARRPDRSGAYANAGIERYGIQYQDRNPSNDGASARLLEILPSEQLAAPHPVEITARFIQPHYIGEGTVELDWLSVELAGDTDRADHPMLRVHGQSDRNRPNHLAVRGGESVLVGSRAFLVKGQASSGDQVTLRIRARDRDCAGDRDCRRGNTGEFRAIFRVPAFPDGSAGGCVDQTWRLRELPGYRFELGSDPLFAIGDEGDVAEVCFEALGR